MARKTFEVKTLVMYVNSQLASKHTDENTRNALSMMLENVLHQTDNYHGFQYLESRELEDASQLPGIRYELLHKDKQFENVDRTRVRYFY